MLRNILGFVLVAALSLSVACSSNRNANNRNDKDVVAKALDQAGFNNIRVDWDKDKRVISLNGRVRSPELKANAGEVAAKAAPGDVVSNELSIEPLDAEHTAKKIESNVDGAIEKNFRALLLANKYDDQRIHYHAKNGVLTLDGKVKTQDERAMVQKLAASVPNVDEVVNKLDVEQKPVQQAAEPR